jgi:preprotein translocase SecE subunit
MLDLNLTSFVSGALLLLTMGVTAAVLIFLGTRLVGPNPPHGLRAGVFVGILGLLVTALIARWIAGWFEDLVANGSLDRTVGIGIAAAVGLVLLVLYVRLFFRPGFCRWLGHAEDMGWFQATSFKASQGQRVRRGTIVGLLTLAGCGIYTLLAHQTLSSGDWDITIPFAGGLVVTLLPHVQYTVPLLLLAASLWFSWRIVNYPPFADFLIATEAEMNKVSWTTRKRLIQDTVVVLVTVILLTVFLFFVDILWIKILSHPWVRVLQVDTAAEKRVGPSEADW